MNERVPMTVLGKKLLDEELKKLISVERPMVIKAIETARGHGDLSENGDYAAAKEKQSFIEGRIQDIQSKLALAEVIDPKSIQSSSIVFGATVTVINEDDEEETYQIVGIDEADIKKKKISISSPLARSLIGKQTGEEIEVHAPKGIKRLEIVSVIYK